jgi:hypothetical protein
MLILQKKIMIFGDYFKSVVAISAVFKLGFIHRKKEYYELSSKQYEKYYATEDEKPTVEEIFVLLSYDAQKYNEIAAEDVFFTENEISGLNATEKLINRYCENSSKPLETFEDKLHYVASLLHPFFRGTKVEIKLF